MTEATESFITHMISAARTAADRMKAPQATFDAYWPGLAERCESDDERRDVERRLRVACGLESEETIRDEGVLSRAL
jgi:hypothetical protein